MKLMATNVGSSHSALVSSFHSLKIGSSVSARASPASRRRAVIVEARTMEPSVGMMGTKCGMRTFFTEEGLAHACSIIGFEKGNMVAQVKTEDVDGYNSVQVGYRIVENNYRKKVSKPVEGHLKKFGCPPMRKIREYKLRTPEQAKEFESGQQLNAEEIFKVGDYVDVAGTTIGKGFQGAIKRWGHKRGLRTHGSKSYRQHGSIGSGSATPSRVLPGMKMAGQMGNKRTKIKRLEILQVEPDYIAVKGAVPGKSGNVLEVVATKVLGQY
ncbi:hypothetical protein BSKO_09483 [Bryopsis sp. KO-2023]|nr:hypothetical protein BSKO_09483 [Bryopsis sp. KO-2023]